MLRLSTKASPCSMTTDSPSINGLEHLVRTHAPILHAHLTPASRGGGRDRHHVRRLQDFSISYILPLQRNRYIMEKHCFERVRRQD